ncbi:hypothetical protein J7E95_34510 [Streptomyces sp. ISL-14]|nr:hypothetical protein [Streptomyces sp. ISL-14]
MTAVTTIETSTAVAPARGPRGLLWAMLRLHRSALWFWVMLMAVGAGALLWAYGPGADAAWAEYHRMGCGTATEPGLGCDYTGPAYSRYDTAVGIGTGALGLTPFLTAAWAGGALIGRELESGTAQLAWTQSVSPARWLAAKLAVPAVLLTAGTGGLLLVNLWARQDGDPNLVGDWYLPDVFLGTGPTAVAYPLAGLALGALAGLLWRRALPAAGVGFAVTLVLYNVLERYRDHLWPTATRSEKGELELPRSAWQQDWDITWGRYPGEGTPLATSATFHPRSHFWPLQYVETGIVLVVAAAATLAAFRLLHRRMP